MRPKLLLLDEPLASLDAGHKREILPYLVRLRDDAGIPIVYVSHTPAEVRRIATTVVRLDGGSRRRHRRARTAQGCRSRHIYLSPRRVPASHSAKPGMRNRVLSRRIRGGQWFAMDDSPALTPICHVQASDRPWASFAARAQLCAGRLGFVAARHGILIGMSPLVLALHRYVWAGLVLIPVAALGGFGDLGRVGLCARHRHHIVRRLAARAVELLRLRLCAAWPRRDHSAIMRGAWRPRPLKPRSQREAAAAAHPRRSRDGCRARHHRHRGAAYDRRARLPRRHDVRRRGLLFCGLRHAAAAVAHFGDARGGADEHRLARRFAAAVFLLR